MFERLPSGPGPAHRYPAAMRGTSDRVGGRGGEPHGHHPAGRDVRPPTVQTRRMRHAGEGVRIEVVRDQGMGGVTRVIATLMPEAGRTPLSGAFLRRALEAAWEMADRSPMTVLSPAVTPTEAGSFAEAGFVTTSELHLLTHDLALPARRVGRANTDAAPTVRLRRGANRDLAAALRVDEAAFAPGWTMTPRGLANARAATPVTRLRVAELVDIEPVEAGDLEPVEAGDFEAVEAGDFAAGAVAAGDRVGFGGVAAGARPGLVGYALTGRSGRRGYLQRLAVDPAQHRRGIGSALVLDAIRWCRRRGVQRLVVNTQVGNEAALGLYRRTGFIESSGRLYTMEYRTPLPPDSPGA